MSNTPQTKASRLADEALVEFQCGELSVWTGRKMIDELLHLVAENSDLRERNAAMGNAQEIALDTATEHALRADELYDLLATAEAERDQLRAQVERLQATEPFGYFRAEPMGWTDCAATDEGAIALYERPAAPAVPQGEPVAVIGSGWTFLWASGDAIEDIVKRHGLKIGSKLYATPAAPSQPVNRPQNCGTSYCSCIECVCEPEPVTLTDEVTKNAARYVWLRDVHIGNSPESINLNPAKNGGLDAAIDALREKEGHG